MREKIIYNFERIFVLLFSILPIIDSINGILVKNELFSLGSMYKVTVMVFLLIFIIFEKYYSLSNVKITMIACLYILLSMLFNVIVQNGSFISVSFPIKMIFNILLFSVFFDLINREQINGYTFYKILDNSVYLMIVALFLPYILGLGYSTYSGNIGYKGFFYSQNELNAVLIILFFFCLHKLTERRKVREIFQLIAITVAILLMSTKSSLIVVVAGYGVFLLNFFKKSDFKTKKYTIISLIIIISLSSGFIKRIISGFMARQNSLFNMYDNSILDTLVSGRTFYLENAWSEFIKSPFVLIQFFFGNGFVSEHLIEMDYFDIFFYLGIVGLITLILFFLRVYKKSNKNFKTDRSVIRKFGFLMIFLFIGITGHVLFLSTSGWYFVLFCFFNMFYKFKKSERDS